MAAPVERSLSAARARLSLAVDEVRAKHRPLYMTRSGRRVAAVIGSEDLDALIDAAEDLFDVEAAREARAEIEETGDGPIPWTQVKADVEAT